MCAKLLNTILTIHEQVDFTAHVHLVVRDASLSNFGSLGRPKTLKNELIFQPLHKGSTTNELDD